MKREHFLKLLFGLAVIPKLINDANLQPIEDDVELDDEDAAQSFHSDYPHYYNSFITKYGDDNFTEFYQILNK